MMDRPKSEALQKTLARMQKNAMPPTGDQCWTAFDDATPSRSPSASLEQAVPPMVPALHCHAGPILLGAYWPYIDCAAVTHVRLAPFSLGAKRPVLAADKC